MGGESRRKHAVTQAYDVNLVFIKQMLPLNIPSGKENEGVSFGRAHVKVTESF